MTGIDQRMPDPRPAVAMHRATVCLWTDSIEEKVDFTTWLTAWKKRMTYVSHDYGCGCGIHLFDLEGPREAIAALPSTLQRVSSWTEGGIKRAPVLLSRIRVYLNPIPAAVSTQNVAVSMQ